MVRFNKILVPTDFGESSQVAYTYANEFAAKFGGEVDLMHIIPTMKYLSESIGKLGLPLDMDTDIYPKTDRPKSRLYRRRSYKLYK